MLILSDHPELDHVTPLQPFYSTGRITKLVKQAEAKSQLLLAQEGD